MASVRGEVSILPSGTLFSTGTASGGNTAGAALVAATTGMSIFLTDLILSALTACTFTLREDTSTATYLSIDFGATNSGGNFSHSFLTPLKITSGKPLQYTASDKLKVNVSGYYGS